MLSPLKDSIAGLERHLVHGLFISYMILTTKLLKYLIHRKPFGLLQMVLWEIFLIPNKNKVVHVRNIKSILSAIPFQRLGTGMVNV